MQLAKTLVLAAAIACTAAPAHAEGWRHGSATVPLPFSPSSATDDALVMFANPAGLGLVPDLQFVYLHDELGGSFGRGDAAALQLGGLGFGMQYVRPDAAAIGDYVKYTVPLGIPLGEHAAVGVGLDVIDPVGNGRGTVVAWSAGLLLRPVRVLSVGLVGENLGGPAPYGVPLGRVMTLGIGLRPVGEALTLATDLRFVDDGRKPPADFYVKVVPVRGFSLFARVSEDASYAVGAGVDFTHVGFAVTPSVDDRGNYAGISYMARLSAGAYEPVVDVKNQVAVIAINKTLHRKGALEFDPFGLRARTALDVVADIEEASHDRSVAAILLRIEENPLTLAQADEIARALDAYREKGGKVYAHFDTAANVEYLLAASADAVFAGPGGHLLVGGLKGDLLFLKGLLEKIDVTVQTARVGKFKSFPEMLLRDSASPESLEQLRALVADFQEEFVARIARARKLPAKEVEALLDKGFLTPEEARDARLVDAVLHEADLEAELERRVGRGVTLRDDPFDAEPRPVAWQTPARLAVLKIEGGIVQGEGSPGIIGGGTTGNTEICEAARALADDTGVRAVVVRIDSGGGSGTASEIIWRCLRDLRARKPVVVSMGGAAASGGYYTAVPADYIFADPFTVTGSIGVFALKLNISGLARKIGITHQTVKLSKGADAAGAWRDLDEQELKRLQSFADGFYAQFKLRVAEGRKLSLDDVEKVAQGRVWSGKAALAAKLVDGLGGFRDALRKAKVLAGLDPDRRVAIEVHPERPSVFATIGRRMLLYADPIGALKAELRAGGAPDLRAELPYELEIR